MKTIICFILSVLLTTSLFSQIDNTIKWQSDSIKIDGHTTDWKTFPPFYEDKTKLAFDIRNDSSSLYMYLKISEQKTQFKIARAGMTINFTTSTKPARKAKITFAPFITQKMSENNNDKAKVGEKKSFSIKQKYSLTPAVVTASGFAISNSELSFTNRNDSIITYAVGWDTLNSMYIEFQIPLREFFGDNYNLKQVSQKEIALKIQENAIENPTMSGGDSDSGQGGEMMKGSGMGSHGGSGGMGGGGMGGGGHGEGGHRGSMSSGADSQDRMAMFEQQTLKQKFKLNSNTK